MANPYAGEVALMLNGERQVLKLTLGALAELEESLESRSLIALVERFEQGAFSTRDVQGFTRSKGQIAAQLGRALTRGRRYS